MYVQRQCCDSYDSIDNNHKDLCFLVPNVLVRCWDSGVPLPALVSDQRMIQSYSRSRSIGEETIV